MHWALLRLLRLAPDALPARDVRTVLHDHLTADALATEATYFVGHPGFERPYGWGLALMLAHELSTWDDPDARRWAANIRSLADTIAELFLAWLARATYPSREGAHANSAFGLVRALPLARARMHDGRPFAACGDQPGGPPVVQRRHQLSGGLGAQRWRLPVTGAHRGRADERGAPTGGVRRLVGPLPAGPRQRSPVLLFEPAIVSDPTDGQIVHLHGLNLYRAYAYLQLTRTLPEADPRGPVLRDAARRHAEASLPAVCGGDYMAEHWLACYAVLLLT